MVVVDGVIGSAVKGVSIIAGMETHIVCVGLDQRMIIWTHDDHEAIALATLSESVDNAPTNSADDSVTISTVCVHSNDSPLKWVTGKATAVADISCIAFNEGLRVNSGGRYCAVVGEGVELLSLT